MTTVMQYGVEHLTFQSDRDYDNPLWDVELSVELTAPSGRTVTYDGYWDGGRTWRAAVSLEEVGRWQWRSRCSDADNAGLSDRRGSIECVAYVGNHPLYAHGPLRVAAGGTHFEHADGEPFFWLADTAWNGVIRGDDANWARYLDARVRQQFTVIQFVVPHWRGDKRDERGRPACTEEHPIRIDPAYFQDKDRRIAMINERGLIAAPVVLWSLVEDDLGYKLPEEDAIRLARYIVARYGAYQVAWLLGGDGNYPKMGVERWQRIGRAVFADKHDRPVTLHPCGENWPNEAFRDEPWLDFLGYQSGHGDSDQSLKWLTAGPVVEHRDAAPPKPVINLEPNYEGAYGYQSETQFDDYEVRRAAYWSCLLSPTAGVTYGHDRIWTWNLETGPCEGHGGWGHDSIEPWYTALETLGIASMTLLRAFFEQLDWPALRPAPQLLLDQPGEADPKRFIAAARSTDGDTIVAYLPVGGTVKVDAAGYRGQWFDPRAGTWTAATSLTAPDTPDTPDLRDWLLVLRRS